MDSDIDNSSTSMTMSDAEQESTEIMISIQSKATLDLKKKKKGVFQTQWVGFREFSSWVQEVKTDRKKRLDSAACLEIFSVHEGK